MIIFNANMLIQLIIKNYIFYSYNYSTVVINIKFYIKIVNILRILMNVLNINYYFR